MGRLTEFFGRGSSTRVHGFLGVGVSGRRRRHPAGMSSVNPIEISIQTFGDRAIIAALMKLPEASRRSAIRPALLQAIKHLRTALVQHLSGIPVKPQTGKYLFAMAGQRPALIRARTGLVGYVLKMPQRAELDIDPKDKWYYPAVLEYGSPLDYARYPAFAPIRKAVNANERAVKIQIAVNVGKGVKRQWRRLLRKAGVRHNVGVAA